MSQIQTQIANLLQATASQLAGIKGASPSGAYTFEQKVEMFRATATDKQKREDFAASRAEVVLPLIDEQSTIRSIFQVERLAPGADARYDIPFDDVDTAYMMPQVGGIPTMQVEGAEIHVDTFGVDGGIEWQEDVARDGRFQVAERATRLLANKFIKLEEACGWRLIKAHAATLPDAQTIQALGNDGSTVSAGSGKMNVFTLAEIVTTADEMGTGGRRVTDIYMSPRRFNDLRTQVGNSSLPDDMRSQAWSGSQSNAPVPIDIRFHKVYNTNLVADNKAYAFTQRDGYFYGVMPIRDELKTRDNPIAMLERKIGVFAYERIGFAVLDDKGLLEITF